MASTQKTWDSPGHQTTLGFTLHAEILPGIYLAEDCVLEQHRLILVVGDQNPVLIERDIEGLPHSALDQIAANWAAVPYSDLVSFEAVTPLTDAQVEALRVEGWAVGERNFWIAP